MKVQVLYFGILRERLQVGSEEIELTEGATVGDLQALLAAKLGEDNQGAGAVRVAVNRDYVDSSHALSNNDEVAMIPPVSGG